MCTINLHIGREKGDVKSYTFLMLLLFVYLSPSRSLFLPQKRTKAQGIKNQPTEEPKPPGHELSEGGERRPAWA